LEFHEAHVERLLGKRVHDVNGASIGRLEEMILEIVDGEPVVTEFHVGPGAVFERVAAFVRDVPFFGWLRRPTIHVVPWTLMDLSDPTRPRVRVARHELPSASATPS
jgi:sporulation protein YlmC with PRC-barrel domain